MTLTRRAGGAVAAADDQMWSRGVCGRTHGGGVAAAGGWVGILTRLDGLEPACLSGCTFNLVTLDLVRHHGIVWL